MTNPLTPEREAEIRRKCKNARAASPHLEYQVMGCGVVEELLAEVDRLRGENEAIIDACLVSEGIHPYRWLGLSFDVDYDTVTYDHKTGKFIDKEQ